jgi:hypothetical protein
MDDCRVTTKSKRAQSFGDGGIDPKGGLHQAVAVADGAALARPGRLAGGAGVVRKEIKVVVANT